MAAIANRPLVADHILRPKRQSKNHAITPFSFPWDQSLYSEQVLLSSQESDLDQTLALSFLLEDFDNSIGVWDEPANSAPSPLVESPPATPNLGPFALDMDPAELHAVPSSFPDALVEPVRISNQLGDSVPFEDSMNDEPLLPSPQSLDETSDVPSRDSLCSSPLSWERLKLGCRLGNSAPYAPLTPEEESRLYAIAMSAQSGSITPPFSPSPEPQDTRKRNSQKRRLSEVSKSNSSPLLRSKCLAQPKTPHYMVEKRYRTNLNKKIAALRDSVPSLRVIDKENPCSEDLDEDLKGLSQAKRLNKATILTKAVEYIVHLEKRNKCLTKEIQAVKSNHECILDSCNGPIRPAGRLATCGGH